MNSPRITVLMPVYNGERFLKEAVDSILCQTFTGLEFLVMNDGSTDRSMEILQSYSDPRIRIASNDQNLGLIASLNRGLSLAKGEYIARMDADDVSMPDRLERQYAFMVDHPEVGILGTHADVIDPDGRKKYGFRYPETHGEIVWGLCFGCPLIHGTMLARKSCLSSTGGYNAQYQHCEDHELYVRLSGMTRFANLARVLLLIRRHEHNVSVSYKETQAEKTVFSHQAMMSGILETPVPLSVCRSIYENHYRKPHDVLESARLIRSLFAAWETKANLSVKEKTAVSRDAARRMLRMTRHIRRNPKVFRVYVMALRLDPACLLSALYRKIIRPFRSIIFAVGL